MYRTSKFIAVLLLGSATAVSADDCTVDAALTAGDPDPLNAGCTLDGDDTLTILSGVTLDTGSASHGIYSYSPAGSANNVITNNGTILTTGSRHGIRNRRIEDAVITNNGTISSGQTAIFVHNRSHGTKIYNYGDLTSASLDGIRVAASDNVTFLNAGSIQTNGTNDRGIKMLSSDNSIVTNSGNITTTGRNGDGIFLNNSSGMTVTNTGTVSTSGRGAEAIRANWSSYSTANTFTLHNSGTISATGNNAYAFYLRNNAQSDIYLNAGSKVHGTMRFATASTLDEITFHIGPGVTTSFDMSVAGGDYSALTFEGNGIIALDPTTGELSIADTSDIAANVNNVNVLDLRIRDMVDAKRRITKSLFKTGTDWTEVVTSGLVQGENDDVAAHAGLGLALVTGWSTGTTSYHAGFGLSGYQSTAQDLFTSRRISAHLGYRDDKDDHTWGMDLSFGATATDRTGTSETVQDIYAGLALMPYVSFEDRLGQDTTMRLGATLGWAAAQTYDYALNTDDLVIDDQVYGQAEARVEKRITKGDRTFRMGMDLNYAAAHNAQGTLNGVTFDQTVVQAGFSARPYVGGAFNLGNGSANYEVGASSTGLISGQISFDMKF